MTTLAPAPDAVPSQRIGSGVFNPKSLLTSLPEALRKLDPRTMWHSPVMFVVLVGAVLTTGLAITEPSVFAWWITVWLWLTVLFANLAEAVAEGRGRAQAASLRATRRDTTARRLRADDTEEIVPATELRVGDQVVCEAGDVIPGDGDVIVGVASVDESAITGESAPVIRESGGDRSAVTGGTKVLSDRIVVEITAAPGSTFIDRMIALVEGASRQKTPNEIALNILLASLTIIFLLVVATLQPLAIYSGAQQQRGRSRRAPRVPHPDHDRGTALGHRHRGHGPAGPAQRARDVRSCRRGGWRRLHAASRQDGDDHAREPTGDRAAPGTRRRHRGAGGRRAALEPRRRDPRGAIDRGAVQGALRPACP